MKPGLALALVLAASPAFAHDEPPKNMRIEGEASWYGGWHHGRLQANGQPFDMNAPTIAHRQLPLGTRVRIRNTRNNRRVIATVTDRGPYVGQRVADLSRSLARRLDFEAEGLAPVEITVLPTRRRPAAARR